MSFPDTIGVLCVLLVQSTFIFGFAPSRRANELYWNRVRIFVQAAFLYAPIVVFVTRLFTHSFLFGMVINGLLSFAMAELIK